MTTDLFLPELGHTAPVVWRPEEEKGGVSRPAHWAGRLTTVQERLDICVRIVKFQEGLA